MLDDYLDTLPKGRGAGRLLSPFKKKTEARATFALWGLWLNRTHPNHFQVDCQDIHTGLNALEKAKESVAKDDLGSFLLQGNGQSVLWIFRDMSAIPGRLVGGSLLFAPDVLRVYDTTPKIQGLNKWYSLAITGKGPATTTLSLREHNDKAIEHNISQLPDAQTFHPALHLLKANIDRLDPFTQTIAPSIAAQGQPGQNWPDFLPWRTLTADKAKSLHAMMPALAMWIAQHYGEASSVSIRSVNFPRDSRDILFLIHSGNNTVDKMTLTSLVDDATLPTKVRALATSLKDSLQGFTYTPTINDRLPKEPSRLYTFNDTYKISLSSHEKMRLIHAFGGVGGFGRT